MRAPPVAADQRNTYTRGHPTTSMNGNTMVRPNNIMVQPNKFQTSNELSLTEPNRDALDVANYFIELSGYTKTPMQIQKMTYIAHGYMLGIHGIPLVRDRVEAWKLGPVFPNVFQEFKQWKFNPIGGIRYKPEPFTERQQEVLDRVMGSYGRFCGYYLSQITHDDDKAQTPWRQCYVEGSMHTPIPDHVTQAYYRQLYERAGYYF